MRISLKAWVGLLAIDMIIASTALAQYQLSISDAAVGIGQTTEVTVTIDTTPGTIQGWEFGVCPSNLNLQFNDIAEIGALAAINNGAGPDIMSFCTDGRVWTVSVILSANGAVTFPVGPALEIYSAAYTGSVQGTTELFFCADVCAPGGLVFVIDAAGNGITPTTLPTPLETQSANVIVGTAPVQFLRSDADGDGNFVALLDALYVLNFAFAGGPEPLCYDAADFDDNGSVVGLVDGVGILNFGFAGGAPPAAPYPLCGLDATVDNLVCGITGCP